MAPEKTIWTIYGCGRGRAGSAACVQLGSLLAERGFRVLLADAGPAAPIHGIFGITEPEEPVRLPGATSGEVAGAAAMAPVDGLSIVRVEVDDAFTGPPLFADTEDHDIVIIDGAMAPGPALYDIFSLSDRRIIIMTPEPESVQKVFSFLKGCVYRSLERLFAEDTLVTALIENETDRRNTASVRTFDELIGRVSGIDRAAAGAASEAVGRLKPALILMEQGGRADLLAVAAVKGASETYLGVEPDFIGIIQGLTGAWQPGAEETPELAAVLERIEPVAGDTTGVAGPAPQDRQPGVAEAEPAPGFEPALEPEPVSEPEPVAEPGPVDLAAALNAAFGYNDNVDQRGRIFHVQTEVNTSSSPVIETVVYHGGRVFFTKRTKWKDVAAEEGSREGIREFASRQHKAAMAAVRTNKITVEG